MLQISVVYRESGGGIHPPADDIPGRRIGETIGSSAFTLAASLFYQDLDGDNYPSYLDCNDLDPLINPEAPDILDGIDNNCDGIIDSVITSSRDSDRDFLIMVYPNPVASHVQIELPVDWNIDEIRIRSIDQSELRRLIVKTNGPNINLDLSGYPTGLYLLEIHSAASGVFVKKLLKL